MDDVTNWITAIASFVSAVAAVGAAVGVVFAYRQLLTSKEIAQLQFEDSLAKEYRELAGRLPTKALLGEKLSDLEYAKSFDELFHYIDLSNERVEPSPARSNQCGGLEKLVGRYQGQSVAAGISERLA